MMRLIDADKLKRKAQKESTVAWKMKIKANVETILNQFIDWIDDAPTIEPERKRGRWEMLQIPITPPVYKCSVCGSHALQTLTGCLVNRHYESNLTKFCPNCGADMRGGNAERWEE